MKQLSLNGAWTLLKDGDSGAIPAAVPGCVHTALLQSGLLEEPFFRDNELKQMWVGETGWRYRRTFQVPPEFAAHDRVLLRCFGLDTIASLHLNGAVVGHADNMFRTWEFDVKPHLRAGSNTLEVHFAAPMPFARRMDAEKGTMAGWVEPMRINSGAWIRKEPCNFGWDWGPKMVTSGIWRDIELVAFDTARLADVQIIQHHSADQVSLAITVSAERVRDAAVRAGVIVSRGGRETARVQPFVLADGSAEVSVTIASPERWWPNNMGPQPLYDVEVTLVDSEGAALDTWRRSIGLRTLTLERRADEWGESFYFACNGVPFFAKGANWIPASPYPGEPQRADYERFIHAAADANMNMLRVWGGGVYEDDSFYDLCDRHGIAIWQDFIFACGTYPSFDADFMANVAAEAADNIRRLRHHACLALWCGNNEIEQGLPDSPGWLESMSWDDYRRLFDGLLANLTRELSPQTAYWPGSPHSPLGDRADHSNPNCGDTHLWAVWHGKEPFEWYRTRPDRFVSEFGFQSFPEPDTVNEFTLPDDRSITSYVMEHHQRSGIGNSTIIHYLLDWFRLPTSFESALWLSQVLQGMAMKYAVEHWRRSMPRTMGTLYWQLNDMWPAPSWASLDWKGNWKALHYMARRFYAPLLISGVEDAAAGRVEIHVTSDLDTRRDGVVRYAVTDAAGQPLEQGETAISIAPRASQRVSVLDVARQIAARSPRDVLVWLELHVGGERVSDNLVLLSRPKHLSLPRPAIQIETQPEADDAAVIRLQTPTPALYVWLELPGARFSERFFHLPPGQPRAVRVHLPPGLDHAALADALTIRSLVDTYR